MRNCTRDEGRSFEVGKATVVNVAETLGQFKVGQHGLCWVHAQNPTAHQWLGERIRCHVTRRKVSSGTRSDRGRDARDTFLALAKTCTKLGISYWNYLGARLNVRGTAIPPLPSLIFAGAQSP
jgi:hypothetical protein